MEIVFAVRFAAVLFTKGQKKRKTETKRTKCHDFMAKRRERLHYSFILSSLGYKIMALSFVPILYCFLLFFSFVYKARECFQRYLSGSLLKIVIIFKMFNIFPKMVGRGRKRDFVFFFFFFVCS